MDEMATAADVNPMILNAFAWATMTDPTFESSRDLDRALKWAEDAATKTDHKNPQILDTLARSHAMKGSFDKAVETQEKAIGLATGDMKAALEKTLVAYREKKVPAPEEDK